MNVAGKVSHVTEIAGSISISISISTSQPHHPMAMGIRGARKRGRDEPDAATTQELAHI